MGTILKYDILSEQYTTVQIKNALSACVKDCKAIPHPNNSNIVLMSGTQNYLFDSTNELFLRKPTYSLNHGTVRAAIGYEGNHASMSKDYYSQYIYFCGGVRETGEVTDQCSRYNIVTEKWSCIASLNVARADATICEISESLVGIVGGESASGKLLDAIEVFKKKENTW